MDANALSQRGPYTQRLISGTRFDAFPVWQSKSIHKSSVKLGTRQSRTDNATTGTPFIHQNLFESFALEAPPKMTQTKSIFLLQNI